ncbi:MAG: sulfotransferase domain-containing protein [Cyanobacteria bacterium P01_E01_bin.34]
MTPVFIVAQYKCGTSWLLSALSAHPDILGMREIDIVRAAHARDSQIEAASKAQTSADNPPTATTPVAGGDGMQLPTAQRPLSAAPVRMFFENSIVPEVDFKTKIFPSSKLMMNRVNPDRLTLFFGKSAWSPSAETPGHLDAGQHPTAVAVEQREFSRPQSIRDLSQAEATGLYSRILAAEHPHQAMDAFLETVSARESGASYVVLKAAHQISVLDALQEWRPGAKKIAITRDVRDAAISALHYKKLMKERNATWLQGSEKSYWDLLRDFSVQTRRVIDAARAGDVLLIRYEDLSRDFSGTFSRVLDFIGVDRRPDIVRAINDATSFKSRTGREPGSEGKGLIRRGMVNEWEEYLTVDDRERAWALCQSVLAPLGYTENGALKPIAFLS